MQVDIRDTSVLDSIKGVFGVSLDSLRTDVNNAVSSFNRVIDKVHTKISSIESKISTLNHQISGIRGEIEMHAGNIRQLEGELSSINSRSARDEYEQRANANAASACRQRISTAQHAMSAAKSRLVTAEGELHTQKGRQSSAKSVLNSAQSELENYNTLKSQVSHNIDAISDDTYRSISKIKSSVENYESVQSNVDVNSTSLSDNSQQSNSTASISGGNANAASSVAIDNFTTEVNDDSYEIIPTKAGKRFKCSIQKNNQEYDSNFNVKLTSSALELLSFPAALDSTKLEIIDSFLVNEASKNSVNELNVWVEEIQIPIFKAKGFSVKSTQIEGAEMHKII